MYQTQLANKPVAKIIQGGQLSFYVRLKNSATGDPYDLSSVTEIATCMVNADATELSLTLEAGISIVSAGIGKIQVNLTAAQTALLQPVEKAPLELSLTTSGDPIKVFIAEAYSVYESVC